mmetsp:Transcript_16105/g.18237  ORF Transcript_16105/g.18237 Transcript_16105/m.18237 type:complete len:399 (-) Transcript_16105:210-1406(-)
MEEACQKIISLSENPNNGEALKQLRTFVTSKEVLDLFNTCEKVNSCIEKLNFTQHPLAVTLLLLRKIALRDKKEELFDQIQQLFCQGNWTTAAEIPLEFEEVGLYFADLSVEKKWCYKAIYPLRCALSTYSKDQSTFTRLHTKFVKICLITKHYREAQKVLEIPLLSVSTRLLDTKINRSRIAHELICYFLYGARAYAALKDFNKSIHFCKLAMTVPSAALSAAVVEAYNFYVVVSLILYGEVLPIPKSAPNAVRRLELDIAYNDLTLAYRKRSIDEIEKAITAHSASFKERGHYGLANQGRKAFAIRRITRLTHTYLVISLKDISRDFKVMSPQQTHQIVLEMIDKGDIRATINDYEGMVKFEKSAEQNSSSSSLSTLELEINKVTSIMKRISQVTI